MSLLYKQSLKLYSCGHKYHSFYKRKSNIILTNTNGETEQLTLLFD